MSIKYGSYDYDESTFTLWDQDSWLYVNNGHVHVEWAEDFDLIPWEHYCPFCGYTVLDDETIEPFILCLACGKTTVEDDFDPYELDAYEYAEAMKRQGENQKQWIDYSLYIKSPEWRTKANEAKKRAGWRCQVCNTPSSETTLNAHHRTYKRLRNERPEDITVLCIECHGIFHKNRKLASI